MRLIVIYYSRDAMSEFRGKKEKKMVDKSDTGRMIKIDWNTFCNILLQSRYFLLFRCSCAVISIHDGVPFRM